MHIFFWKDAEEKLNNFENKNTEREIERGHIFFSFCTILYCLTFLTDNSVHFT